MYSFARTKKNTPLLAGMVHETYDRYRKMFDGKVDCMIFELPVRQDQYDWIESEIQRLRLDKSYAYNLYSVITQPLTGGIEVENAFSCIEFVLHILSGLGYSFDRPLTSYTPDELAEMFSPYQIYKGNLLRYPLLAKQKDPHYYDKVRMKDIHDSIKEFGVISSRTLRSVMKKRRR